MKTQRFGRALLVAGVLCMATAMATAQQYNMVRINSGGDGVGMTYVASGVQPAFLYHVGYMADLNNHVNNLAGWTLWQANNINDWGQIVCLARGPDGV